MRIDGIELHSDGTAVMELLYSCRFWSWGIPLHSGGNAVIALLLMYLRKQSKRRQHLLHSHPNDPPFICREKKKQKHAEEHWNGALGH